MNRERLIQVRDWAATEMAEGEGSRFGIEYWGRIEVGCEPTMCLAGYAASVAEPERWSRAVCAAKQAMHDFGRRASLILLDGSPRLPVVAAEWLGLDSEQAHDLFYAGSDQAALELLNEFIELADQA